MASRGKKPTTINEGDETDYEGSSLLDHERADSIFNDLNESERDVITEDAKPGLDKEVSDIYQQASKHRNWLIWFYISYTTALSVFVAAIIVWQAYLRATGDLNMHHIEIIPRWGLDLLVVGMFGQFIGLLTIVTKKVWTFEPFFNHANRNKSFNNTRKYTDGKK